MITRYLTGADNAAVRAVAHARQIGLLVTPDTNYGKHVGSYPFWAADNACFNNPETFDLDKYLAWLDAFPVAMRKRCLFAPAPDVVGDPVKTMKRSLPVLPRIRALGYKAAYVAQDGCEKQTLPWDSFDVLFIGGSTEWKLSPAAQHVAALAKRHGKTVHMGRVNSYKRMKIAHDFGAATADGTFLKFGPTANLPRLLGWLDKLAAAVAVRPLAATA